MLHILMCLPWPVELLQHLPDGHLMMPDDEVNEGGSFLQAVVIPAVDLAVDFERWLGFWRFFEGGNVPVLVSLFVFRMDADGFQVVDNVEFVDVCKCHNASFLFSRSKCNSAWNPGQYMQLI